jgi:hypothetical protein
MGAKTETGVIMMQLYQSFDIWRRTANGGVVRYRCFKEVSSGRYSVQSADFYRAPLNLQQITNLDRQCLELFAEQPPDERSGGFETVQAAIAAYDREFAEEADSAV